jgi:hypothetical protein
LLYLPPGASLELIETPAIAKIDRKNFAYLSISKSFPAFLSACMMAEFDASTMGNTMGAL